jgi:hypothetical protein
VWAASGMAALARDGSAGTMNRAVSSISINIFLRFISVHRITGRVYRKNVVERLGTRVPIGGCLWVKRIYGGIFENLISDPSG